MKFRNIVSVSNTPGLFELKSSKSNGALVLSLDNHAVKFISARLHSVTPLESVEIFTTGDNMPLYQVLEQIKTVDEPLSSLDFKNQDAMISLFAQAIPDYDTERVYKSDIKKILKWYLLLKKNDLLDFTEYLNPVADTATTESSEEPAKEESIVETSEATEAPKEKKTTTKKAAAKKTKVATEEKAAEDTTTAEKPAKKTATKKAAAKKKAE